MIPGRHKESDTFVILLTSADVRHRKSFGAYIESRKFQKMLVRSTAQVSLAYETSPRLTNFTAEESDIQAQLEISILGQT